VVSPMGIDIRGGCGSGGKCIERRMNRVRAEEGTQIAPGKQSPQNGSVKPAREKFLNQ